MGARGRPRGVVVSGTFYVPLDLLAAYLNGACTWNRSGNVASITVPGTADQP